LRILAKIFRVNHFFLIFFVKLKADFFFMSLLRVNNKESCMKRIVLLVGIFLLNHLSADPHFKPGVTPEAIQFSFGGDERKYEKEVSKKIKENGKSKRIKVKETFSQGAEVKDMKTSADGSIYLTGFIHGEASIPQASKVHRLGKGKVGNFSCFVAKLSADGSQVLWFSVLPENSLDPARMVLSKDGTVYVGGKFKVGLKDLSAVHESSNFTKSKVAILKISTEGSKLDWVRTGGPNQSEITGMCIDTKGNIVWTGSPSGQGQASYVIKMDPTGKYVDWADAGKEGKPSWTIYLHDNDEQIKKNFTSFYTKGDKDGFDYDGPGKWGKVKFWRRSFRLGGQVICLPDGDFIITSSYFYYFKEGKNKGFPAFDGYIGRYSSEGKLKWCSNMYQDGDSVHTPDQKPIDLVYDANSDSIYVLFKQHGSNVYRFKGQLIGDTGNLMICWVGKLNASSGKLTNGWYFQNNRTGKYQKNGLPASPPYPKLAGNNLKRIALGKDGNVYLAGSGAPKMWTSANALMPWPADQNGGGQGALVVLDNNLNYLYATCIGSGKSDCSASFSGLAINKYGIFLGGSLSGAGFHKGSAPAWSKSGSNAKRASMVKVQWK